MPFFTSQRGLSGTSSASRKNSTAGTATAVNMKRQAYWPFHERRIISAVASAGTGSAIRQFATCASSTPITIVSWFIDTRRPRRCAGATSAM